MIQLNVKIRAGRIIKGVLDDDLNYSKKDSAAILFPLMVDERINLVMIMRQRNLSRSAGHIAFPGGIKEEGELPFETALREAEEELGIKKSGVDILGYLNPKEVMESRIKIHPVVGIFEKQRFIPDSFEVRKVLVDDLIKVLKSRRIADWGPNYECDRELVWGASSRILDDFYLRVVRSFGSVENFENTIYREV